MLNNTKPYFFLNEMNKKELPAMYSTAFRCLIVVYCFFFGFIVTPFIERKQKGMDL